jgi:hypothetical protein
MNKTDEIKQRERLLYSYFCALERGDFDEVARVLNEAQRDLALERMILEINEELIAEQAASAMDEEAETVRELIRRHLPSALPEDEEEIEMPPLTVSRVVGRLKDDPVSWDQAAREDKAAIERLGKLEEPLPASLTLKSVSEFFNLLGVSVSIRFQKLFRETAIFLSMGREQGMAQMAAARRQKKARNESRKKKR